jgi:hypothetical protein
VTNPDPELRQAYESALTNAGVPVTLAAQCAEISPVEAEVRKSSYLDLSEDTQQVDTGFSSQ